MASVRTGLLEVAFVEDGPANGWPVILAHGFPYDVHAFDAVAPRLAQAGARVIRPYVRGYGPTRFLSEDTMRSGQQAALGKDVIDLLDALNIRSAILAGNDWGGLACCVAAALWPERVTGLVAYAGYDVIDVERLRHPFAPSLEAVQWYQHLFQLERGRECLALHRRDLCRLLWEQWSPGWTFDDATFERTAASFDNPDFVDVIIHCYRFCFGTIPAVTLDGTQDPLKPGGTAGHASMFAARHEHRVVDCGHNIPAEAPEAFADAVLTLRHWAERSTS